MDEVQELDQWARVINSLRVRGGMQICVTGSNSSLFAGHILTSLAGRYVGHDLENMVYLELRRRGYEVSTGINGRNDIDFRAVRDGEATYVQVAYSVAEEATLERELRALKGVPAGARCVLITADRVAPASRWRFFLVWR